MDVPIYIKILNQILVIFGLSIFSNFFLLYSTILLYPQVLIDSMYIEIHVDGADNPLCVPIGSAGVISQKLEKEGKTFRLGKTV